MNATISFGYIPLTLYMLVKSDEYKNKIMWRYSNIQESHSLTAKCKPNGTSVYWLRFPYFNPCTFCKVIKLSYKGDLFEGLKYVRDEWYIVTHTHTWVVSDGFIIFTNTYSAFTLLLIINELRIKTLYGHKQYNTSVRSIKTLFMGWQL
jgi:hypothetical protein